MSALQTAVSGLAAVDLAGFDISPGILLKGVLNGLTYGLLAVGIVLVFRASRFINFAYSAIGLFGAAILGIVSGKYGLPYPIGFALAIITGAAMAAFTEAGLVRRLSKAPRVLGTIITLGFGQFLVVIALLINNENSGGNSFPSPPLLPEFVVSGVPITSPYTAMLIFTPLVMASLAIFLKRSRYGLAIRAAADNPDAASLAGVTASRMVTLSWAISGAIAAFSASLVLPTQGTPSAETIGPALLLFGLAGAVIGRLQSIPVAFGAGIGIGVIEVLVRTRNATDGTAELVLGAVIIAALLLQPRISTRTEVKSDWALVTAKRLPAEFQRVWLIRNLPRLLIAVFIAWLTYLVFVVSNQTASNLTSFVGYAIIGLSVLLVTGLGGQLSLGQVAFASIGALASVTVAEATGYFDLGLLAGVVVAAIVAILVGIPALRLSGLALAVSTLAFALITSTWLLRQEWAFGKAGIEPTKPVIDPYGWFSENGLGLLTSKGYFLFAVVMLAVALFIAGNIRRSSFGRISIALRDNEQAARAFTVASNKRRLQLYGVAGAIAGLGGAVIGHAQSNLTAAAFPPLANIDVVAEAVVGGLTVLSGPILGALYIVALPKVLDLDTLGRAVLTLGWLVLIIAIPAGIGGALQRPWNWLADRIARIRGIDPAAARAAAAGGQLERGAAALDLTRFRPDGRISPGADLTDLSSSPEQAVGLGEPVGAGVGAGAPAMPAGQVITGGSWQEPGAVSPVREVQLSARSISKSFGGVRAVVDVSLDVYRGEILGIIGPNGAGKTTFFEMLTGFTSADVGSVVFEGRDITKKTPEQRARAGLVRSFQSSALFPTLTVLETVMVAEERTRPTGTIEAFLGTGRKEAKRRARSMELLEVMGLSSLAQRQVSGLSTGQRRMVELTCMLALEPRTLLLDEPAGGLSTSEGDQLVELFTAVRRDLGTTLVIVEHDLPLLFRLADRMVAMELGAIIAVGTPTEVRNHPDVVRSYLGTEAAAVQRSGSLDTVLA